MNGALEQMKKILVTGSSGYIGSHLCHMLKDDYEVYGLDINLSRIKLKQFYQVDINRPFRMDGMTFDSVVHLAALVNVGESQKNPIPYYTTNITGTLNVLKQTQTSNFIFASTGAAEACTSAYGISKRAAEDIVQSYCSMGELDYTIFRFYNVIGSIVIKPTNPDGLMHNLMKSAETGEFTIFGNDYAESIDGTCVRDYVHVEEICHSIKLAIEDPANKTECLGHGVGYTVKEMVHLFEKVNHLDIDIIYAPRRDGDAPSSVLEDVSPYMKEMYSINDLVKLPAQFSEQGTRA